MDTILQDVPQKQCNKCLQPLPATTDYFHKSASNKYGLNNTCKKCRGKGTNFGRTRIKRTESEKQCPGCLRVLPIDNEHFYKGNDKGFSSQCKECLTKIREKNKERLSRRRRVVYYKDLQRSRELNHLRYLRYRSHHLQYLKGYRERKQDFLKGMSKVYRSRRRDKHNAYNRARRFMKSNVGGKHTHKQIIEQYHRQKVKCYYCGAKLNLGPNGYHVDHTFPLSRTEGNEPINDISYLVITCPTCNKRKGNKYPWEWPEGGRLL